MKRVFTEIDYLNQSNYTKSKISKNTIYNTQHIEDSYDNYISIENIYCSNQLSMVEDKNIITYFEGIKVKKFIQST